MNINTKLNYDSFNTTTQGSNKSTCVVYRGFTSIDQEMEREIAMQRFTNPAKIVFTQKGFLLRDRG